MARAADLNLDELSDEQKDVSKEIAGSRGGTVRGPFAVWLRNPHLALCASKLGNALRLDGKLDKKLFELTVLIVARHWSAQYEWFVHAKDATDVGLSSDVIEALRINKVPDFEFDDQRLVYDLVTELVTTRTISDSTYQRAVNRFGIDLVVEIVAAAGFYTFAAMTINAFDTPVPGGAKPLDCVSAI
jgi:4-carboxymuconolactone decarboxylase